MNNTSALISIIAALCGGAILYLCALSFITGRTCITRYSRIHREINPVAFYFEIAGFALFAALLIIHQILPVVLGNSLFLRYIFFLLFLISLVVSLVAKHCKGLEINPEGLRNLNHRSYCKLVVGLSAITLLLFSVATYTFFRSVRLYSHPVRTQGKIIANAPYGEKPSYDEYPSRPVVAFKDEIGREYELTTFGLNYKMGQSVEVIYHQDNPNFARIDSFWYLWALPLILYLITGVSSLLLCLIIVLRLRSQKIES